MELLTLVLDLERCAFICNARLLVVITSSVLWCFFCKLNSRWSIYLTLEDSKLSLRENHILFNKCSFCEDTRLRNASVSGLGNVYLIANFS